MLICMIDFVSVLKEINIGEWNQPPPPLPCPYGTLWYAGPARVKFGEKNKYPVRRG